MKLISPKLHGIIDYVLVVFLFLSPIAFNMTTDTGAQIYTLAVVQLALTVGTNYSFGIFRAIPLKLHGVIELMISAGTVIASFTILQYDERSRGFYAGVGIFWFIVMMFTNYDKSKDGIKAPIL